MQIDPIRLLSMSLFACSVLAFGVHADEGVVAFDEQPTGTEEATPTDPVEPLPLVEVQEPTEADRDPFDFSQTPDPNESADDVMRRLLQQRNAEREPGLPGDATVIEPEREPEVVPVPTRVGLPATQVDLNVRMLGLPWETGEQRLFREGDFIVNQAGQLYNDPDERFTVLRFLNLDAQGQIVGGPIVVLQQCPWLERLEEDAARHAEAGDEAPIYEVSGQVHVYRGVNYLLVTKAVPVSAGWGQAMAEAEPEGGMPGANVGGDGSADSVEQRLDALRADQPDWTELGEQVVAPIMRGTGELTGGGPAMAPASAPDREAGEETDPLITGDTISTRRGRLIRTGQGGAALFVFEADSADANEPPVILYPCRLLEQMEDYVAERGDTAIFELSGQVYTYRSHTFLLPTLMRLTISRGNLGR